MTEAVTGALTSDFALKIPYFL